MQEQKISHMQGGKAFAIIFIILAIALIGVFFLLLISQDFNLYILSLIIPIFFTIQISYTYFNPGFTDLIFSEDGIISKNPLGQERLPLEDIKGIWYFKLTDHVDDMDIKPYSSQDNLKGCMVVFGDLECLKGTKLTQVQAMGFTILKDPFMPGYTSLHYRKKLDEVLEYYDRKIQGTMNM